MVALMQVAAGLLAALLGLASSYVTWRTLTTPASRAVLDAVTSEASALLAVDELRRRHLEALEAQVRALAAELEKERAVQALTKHTGG